MKTYVFIHRLEKLNYVFPETLGVAGNILNKVYLCVKYKNHQTKFDVSSFHNN